MSKRNKEKIVSKEKVKSKFGLVSPKQKSQYRDTVMIIKGKRDESVKARFTRVEIITMKKRAKKYDGTIHRVDVGTPISDSEWEKFDERSNWDEFEYITSSGKKIRLLATLSESNRGVMRADPNWRRKHEALIQREGQTTLEF